MHVIFVAGTCSRARRNSKIANKKNYGVLGAKRRVRFEKEITHPAGALTCTCHMHTLTHVRAGERAHMRTQTCVPKSAHTCTTTSLRFGHEKHNRTLTPAHTCDCVKIVLAESAPRMRVYTVIFTFGCITAPEGAVYEPRSEAESAPRKEKTNRAMRMHRRCIRLIHAPFGCMYPHPKGAV